jgi:predicted AlkP superfamily phosphohydrolase/phosphomutase
LSKLVILGIDALDAALLRRWKADLPNFARIMDKGYFAPLESTQPPDSIPAWVTIYTGMQPWEHGVVDSVDYMDIKGGTRALDTAILKGKTFWDVAGSAGKRVCVINPLLAYPVWPVNGVMVNGPVFITGETQAFPPEIATEYVLPELGGMVDFPGRKDLAGFIERTERVTRDQADFGMKLLALEEWDVFFLCFLTLDRVMHFLWRYSDPDDPTYPGENPYVSAIKDFFVLFDSLVGDFMNRLSPDQALMIVSDHGHGMRPTKALYINELLRKEGLLKTREGKVPGVSPVALIEKTKTAFLRAMHRLDLEDWVYRIAALIPKDKRKSLKTSSYAVIKETSLAWVSDTGGGTSFGGIEINANLCARASADYEPLRDRLIDMLSALEDGSGHRIIDWVKRREEIFEGKNVEKYPDVVFELREDFGVDRTLFSGITGRSTTHKKVSGGHSKYGTFMLFNSGHTPSGQELHITSVFESVQKILGLA